jgi:parallel beta-helix repeat protein
MVDAQAFSSTSHPIVRLEDDYNNILDHFIEKPLAYLVRVNGSYYEAIQGGSSSGAGTIAYGGAANAGGTSGTDAQAVIQAALDNLTSGRDYKETVVLKGDIALDSSIDLNSYTTLDMRGARLTLDNSADEDVIKNKDANNTYIDIIGGVIDGNQANQTAAQVISGIYFDTVTYGNIMGVTITNPLRFGIRIDDSSFYNTVTNCYIDDSDEQAGLYLGPGCQFNRITNVHVQDSFAGISLNGAVVHNTFTNCVVYNGDGVGFTLYNGADRNAFSSCVAVNCGQAIPGGESGGGFYLEDECDNNTFTGCVSQGNAEDGFTVNGIGGVCVGNTFTGCIAESNTLHGFDLTNASAYTSLVGCQSISNTRNGIFIYKSSSNTISGCVVRNNSQAGAGTYSGIQLDDAAATCEHNVITGCKFIDDQVTKTQDYAIEELNAANYTRIVGNNFITNRSGGVLIVGANSMGDYQALQGVSTDLSGAAVVTPVFTALGQCEIIGYSLIYTEASSADAGIQIDIGNYADDNKYDTVTTEGSKALGYIKTYVTGDLANTQLAAGDTVTCKSAGGKVGTGEIRCLLNVVAASYY